MKAAFFDVDGTLTKHRVWNGLMEYFVVHRVRLLTVFGFLLFNYSLYFLYKLKLIEQVVFRGTWARNMSWLFKGMSGAQVEEIWDWVVEERIRPQLRDDVVPILKKHKGAGGVVFLVSGGPVGLLERLAKDLGADHAVGTMHEIQEGRYTGVPMKEACQGDTKVTFVEEKIRELGLNIDLMASYAYADSMVDIPLLEMVGNPVAVYPEEDLLAVASAKKWRVFPE